MKSKFTLATFVLFLLSVPCSAQHSPPANKSAHTFGELYGAVKEGLFSLSDDGIASTATLYFEPYWDLPESQITVQFPFKGAPIVTSFTLAPGQKPISSVVSSAMKRGVCDAATIAKRVRIIKRRVPVSDRLSALLDRLWLLDIVPRPVHSVHLDAAVYVLEVHGQDSIRVSTDDHESPVVKWMEEISDAASDR
jgi:hypothetical protein